MHSNSDNIVVEPYTNANEVIDELFESLFSKYQTGLETSVREREVIFSFIQFDRCIISVTR